MNEDISESVPKNDVIMIPGDPNANIEKGKYNRNVGGKETIHVNTSANGTRLCSTYIGNRRTQRSI